MMPGLLRPSFRQLLLLAFLLVAGLLGAASLRALMTLESLVTQSRSSAAHAVQLSADAQLLAERSVTMERAARQYLVLEDAALLQRYQEASRDAKAALARLAQGLPGSPALQGWRKHETSIAAQLAAPEGHDSELVLAADFSALAGLNEQLADQVRGRIEQRNTALLDGLEAGRLQLSGQLLVALMLAVSLALVFGLWLARPLRQLEDAIIGLGENKLGQPIAVRGPADLRLLGQRLDWLRLRLQELDADKARFLRHISHELKTPLAALREGVALLEDGVAGSLTSQQTEIAQILAQNVVALQGQIEDLLRYHAAGFEARQLNRKPTSLHALLVDVVNGQRLQWQAKGLKLKAAGEALLANVDPEKLAVALGNLLSNAIRFSPPGGEVLLTVGSRPGWLQIAVSDQGPGVAPADRQRIFEPFYQGERQPAGARRGSGIGLSIVQEYVEAHGGQILLTDNEPGTCFVIELPHEH
ncbi:HAMP domain-containing sensor histidine kinase [Chitinimonas sp.]|uniref:HAMP domain-containing sensor histidine kinase n=1 Tax=Chitinimonas sp. TaxID=1934313 RepID=UPI002F91E416